LQIIIFLYIGAEQNSYRDVKQGGLQNGLVAVKKLSTWNDFSDKLFLDEFTSLKRVKHKNIVRLLGYCAYTLGEVMEVKGENMIVDEAHKKFLCFEYVPNGNLHYYLKGKKLAALFLPLCH
jgi:serine/threonine protein kinase